MSYLDYSLNNITDNVFNKVSTMNITSIKNLIDVPYIENIPDFNNLPFISNGILYNYPEVTPFIQLGQNKFLLNIIRSPIVPPEKKYNTYLTSFAAPPSYPTSLDLFRSINYNNPVKLQVGSTCAAHSTACIKEYQAFIKNNYNDTFSPDYIYLHRINQNTDGMYLDNALYILQNNGACPSVNFPNGITSKNNIPLSSITVAKSYKINTYAAIYQKLKTVDPNPSSTIEKLKTALYLHGPCLIAFMIYNNNGILINDVHDGRIWVPQNSSQKSQGGHCMTVVGYDINKGFLIRNSWGPSWNNDGHAWLPYSDFGTVNEAVEIWTSTDLISELTPSLINPESNPEPTSNTDNNLLYLLVLPIVILIIVSYKYRLQIFKYIKL